jgi:1,4-dihydroxy-2-naphthoate octaprenyltransferase
MERRIRTASIIVTIGLIIALISLVVNHPLAFLAFLILGVLTIVIGIAYYLFSLLRGGANGEVAPLAD